MSPSAKEVEQSKAPLEKLALTVLSKWLGVVKGAQINRDTLRITDVASAGDTRFSDTAALDTTTKYCEIGGTMRATFGEHGFVSKPLRRCFAGELIKRMISIIKRFLGGSGAAPLERVEKVACREDLLHT